MWIHPVGGHVVASDGNAVRDGAGSDCIRGHVGKEPRRESKTIGTLMCETAVLSDELQKNNQAHRPGYVAVCISILFTRATYGGY